MSERSEFWLSHLSAIEAEGITTKAYAQREGLSPQALYQWRKRLVADARPHRTQRGGLAPTEGSISIAARPPRWVRWGRASATTRSRH